MQRVVAAVETASSRDGVQCAVTRNGWEGVTEPEIGFRK